MGALDELIALGTQPQRRAAAQRLQQGTPVDYSKGRGLPLLLAGLANLGGAGLGGYQEGQLDQQQIAGRKNGLMDILNSPDPTRAGMTAMASGDPVMGQLGQTAMAQPGLALQRRLHTAQAGEAEAKLAREQSQYEAANNPNTANALRSLFGKMAPGVDMSQVPSAAMSGMMPVVEKYAVGHESAEARKEAAKNNNFYREQAMRDREDRQTTSQMEKLGNSLDPRHRSSGLAKISQRLDSIDSGLGGVVAPGDDLNAMNDQKMYELARVYDRVVSNGNGSLGGTKHLVPSTALGSLASFVQYLKNEPVGQNQGAFAKQMLDAIERERGIANEQITKSQRTKVARAAGLAKKDPMGFANILSAAGLNPDEFDPETWNYKGGPKTEAGPVNVISPEGVAGQIPADKLDAALKRGFKRAGP